MDSEKDTLPNLQTVLDAINNLRQGMDTKIENLGQEMNVRFNSHEQRLEQMRLEMMSFDVRIDRIEAIGHEALNIGYNVRADVKVLREEVSAWSKEMMKLQNA